MTKSHSSAPNKKAIEMRGPTSWPSSMTGMPCVWFAFQASLKYIASPLCSHTRSRRPWQASPQGRTAEKTSVIVSSRHCREEPTV